MTGRKKICVVGGGAAGYFAAVNIADAEGGADVILLEGTARPLTKVKISGGGRCNVTNACTDPADVVRNYPRGAKELRGPMTKFGPRQTVEWFAARGVSFKTEIDGRVFPVTNSSDTIVSCLQTEAQARGVDVRLGTIVDYIDQESGRFQVVTKKCGSFDVDAVVLATGSSPTGYKIAAHLGHRITETVPSLFTFNVVDPRLTDLAGIAFDRVELKMRVETDHREQFQFAGPLLITHWGLSGPAVLKLSAFGARALHDANYHAELMINFCPSHSLDHILTTLANLRRDSPRQRLDASNPFNLPKRFWARLVDHCGISADCVHAHLTTVQCKRIATELKQGAYRISGKGVFKEEFVTCGGVDLTEINFQTMESKVLPGLYFAGEILDIDGITGGFNFQNAWTTGWLAAQAIRGRC